jgi:hypothetical protein
MNPNYKFRYILWLAGILVAIMGAAFSIYGLSKVFATYALYIIILGIGIEIGKIVGISHLTQNWKHIKILNKSLLSFIVGLLMLITSIGVYGFLSNAYQSTAYQLENVDKKISIVQNKKQIFLNEIAMYDKQVQNKQDRANKLSNLREKQEKRIDDLYGKDMTTAAKSTQKFVTEADQNINDLNKDIAATSNKISQLNDSVIKYDMVIADMSNNQYAVDLGPLKYLAKATNSSMDRVVGIFIILLILVIDPLAVILIISANELIVQYRFKKRDDDEKIIKDDKIEESVIQAPITRVTPTQEEKNSTINKIVLEKNQINDSPEIIEELVVEEPVVEEIIEEEIVNVTEELAQPDEIIEKITSEDIQEVFDDSIADMDPIIVESPTVNETIGEPTNNEEPTKQKVIKWGHARRLMNIFKV